MTKIMLIEDDDTMVSLLTTLLGIEGYEVVAFQGNGEILSAIQQEMPDVILLDVNLKNMGITQISGFDLLASIRADAGHAFLSAKLLGLIAPCLWLS